MADREKRTAGCIAKHALQCAEHTVRAKSDARTGGASGTDQTEDPRSVSFVASAKAGAQKCRRCVPVLDARFPRHDGEVVGAKR
jgi:hypothetical protein